MLQLMVVSQFLLILGTLTLIIRIEDSISFSLPPNCRKSCGNISFEYPFGIENGCFLAIGFNLSCISDRTTDFTPTLLLGDGTTKVRKFNMEKGTLQIESRIITMDVDDQYINDTVILDLKNWPYSPLPYNRVYVMGCSVFANLVDLTANHTYMSSCITVCSAYEFNQLSSTDHCYFDLYDANTSSLGVRLVRLSNKELDLVNTSSIKVFMHDQYPGKELLDLVTSGNITTTLAWYISDGHHTCEEAKKNISTYACRSLNSNCYGTSNGFSIKNSANIGYICQCSLGYHGNPYLPHGCQEAPSIKLYPDEGCERTCGNISIPFPFGLTVGCSRDRSFVLHCNGTSNYASAALQRSPIQDKDKYIVSNVSLEEGRIEFKTTFRGTYYYRENIYEQFLRFLEQRTTYSWVIAYDLCKDAKKSNDTYACVAEHSQCLDNILGYRCKCSEGYQGNPYLIDGCEDIDECKHPEKYRCYGTCNNTEGNYTCTCEEGKHGDPTRQECIPNKQHQALILGIIIGGSNGVGLLLLSISFVILRQKWKRIKQNRVREKHFRRNHGLLLQQLISSSEDNAERTKIFSLKEIEKATNYFDETRIVGRGGHGTVYKGILLDQRVVAIKKSKIIKKSEIDQFINEVAVLSQINHRNVVKLFGCCLESEVPLLVYEFISNGTLLDHLHNGNSTFSWEDRLRIATEVAGALAYLHTAAIMPIFHRDIKSTNILLDDNFTAKVSDFGASRLIPLDQTHLVTAVQGTFGYLDPEYYQTSQLTEKSDVYSFGVILLELLTGKKPIYPIEHEFHQNLPIHFIQTVRDNRPFELVADCAMREANKEELVEVIQLIEMCLKLKGAKRPTMKEVEHKLQGLRSIRMKKRDNSIIVNDGETDSLLHVFSEPTGKTIDGTSMSYSLQKELMWSAYTPR